MHDLIIIGGGPAGVAAGVYAARKRLKSVLITEAFGGQSTDSLGVENWIGTVKISGIDMAHALKAHLDAYKGDIVETVEGERVTKLERADGGFSVTTSGGKSFSARAVLVASGATRKKLHIPGAAEFENKGVVYCASCDGPLFADQDVAVVGGGNAGLETCAQLLAYCKSVTLIHRHDMLKGDKITVERLSAHPNFKSICKSEPTEITGDKFVSGMKTKHRDTGEEVSLAVTGVFVEIGVMPNTDYAEGLLDMDEVKRIKVDAHNQHTNVEGIWAAGDCTDELYHQNNIAAGDAVKALEDIYQWLMAH
jgi:alkyl hydroperoxide reductase subunit F